MAPFDVDPDWYKRQWEAPPQPREPQRAPPMLWVITATLLAWFITSSTVAALLSTWLGWLALAAR